MNTEASTEMSTDDLARVFKILSEPSRLKILLSMGLECTPVSAIIARTGLSQSNVSFHLRIMREAGLVKGERNGPYIYYCLYDTKLLELLDGLGQWRADLLRLIETHRQDTPPASAAG